MIKLNNISACDIRELIKGYSEELRHDPNNYPATCIRSFCYLQNNDLPSALSDCERAIAVSADRPEAYYIKSLIKQHQGKGEEASELFTRATLMDFENEPEIIDSLEEEPYLDLYGSPPPKNGRRLVVTQLTEGLLAELLFKLIAEADTGTDNHKQIDVLFKSFHLN